MPKRAPSHSETAWGNRVKRNAYTQQEKWTDERQVYSSTRWRKLRLRVLKEEPLCRDPYGWHAQDRRLVRSGQVDHIRPLRVALELAYVRSNLQGLCTGCHRRKTLDDLQAYPIGAIEPGNE